MTGLLVSVRSAAEAHDALAGGADIIDVKEPGHGPLGRAAATVWRATAQVVAGRVPVSAALGELAEQDAHPEPEAAAWESLEFAKLGLAGCARMTDWRSPWRKAIAGLPSSVRPVAVSYADWRRIDAPPPCDVLETGASCGCTAWLMDTYDKTNGGLLSHVTPDDLAQWIADARAYGMVVVLAGSLTHETLAQVLPLAPDFIGVRGAVCRDGRGGALDAELVRRLASRLRGDSLNIRR